MANESFFSFDEALDELRLKEEELKRLVSEGEIRAFREGETMKLRRQDVEALRTELSGGEIVDLGDGADELVFEDGGAVDDVGMATEDLAEADTLLDDDDVEDVGEIDLGADEGGLDDGGGLGVLDDIEDEEPSSRPVRRTPATAAQDDDEGEEVWVRGLMLLNTAVLVLAMPVCLAIGTGELTGLARSIAGMFTDV